MLHMLYGGMAQYYHNAVSVDVVTVSMISQQQTEPFSKVSLDTAMHSNLVRLVIDSTYSDVL